MFNNFWPKLTSLRLKGCKTPNELLARFIIEHASTLRHLCLTACFLGYSSNAHNYSWKGIYREDNMREMLETLGAKTTLEIFRLTFGNDGKPANLPIEGGWFTEEKHLWDKLWDKAREQLLFRCFLCGEHGWPMPYDNPELHWHVEMTY
ncbi:hypothetical protein B0O99DRAFT_593122 [Bisporella sp. PMI_857]|nr:hypothetical protein B0O99DRAFT_593122 [Bisporella sp. PMI_857]